MVTALDRKLARDLLRLRGPVITIALVMGCGIAQLVTFVTLTRSLVASRDAFYRDLGFADLFAHVDRAPRAVVSRLAELPGVTAAEGRVVADFRLVLPGVREPVLGHFVSVEHAPRARLDRVFIEKGRALEPWDRREVVVSELFAEARGLRPGSTLVAVLNGREVPLRVVGVGTSPDYVVSFNPRTGYPDAAHFGVVWMEGKALDEVLGRSGEVNDLALALGPGASPAEVAAAVDRVLEPWGGSGTILRADQLSAHILDAKIEQYRGMSKFVPFLFLGVAAFLLNLVLSRIVGTQREQIATLKALGYPTGAVARHYLLFAMVISLLGGVLGLALGLLEADLAVHVLLRYYNLPVLVFRADLGAAALGMLASLAAGAVGAWSATRRVVRLPAAEAMQPEPPERFKPTFIERHGLDRWVSVASRMVLRDIERHPLRLALSSLSVALATAIMLVGTILAASLERAVAVQFERVQREDLAVSFDRPREAAALGELAHLPGVRRAEAQRVVPVRVVHGWHERDLAILGVPEGATLRRLEDLHGERLRMPADGLTLSRPLERMLGVAPGDELEVTVLEAGRRKLRLRVAGFIDDFTGLSAYMDLGALQRALAEPPTLNGAYLAIEPHALGAVVSRLERLPGVASFSQPRLDRAEFESQLTGAMRAVTVLLGFFAAIIAVGMVFNNARIALAVRSRDLATLRILGFTQREVAMVLLGEQAVQLVLGVGAGLPLGAALGAATLSMIPPDLFRVPAAFDPMAMVRAAAVVLGAGFGCAWWVRREANHLDLVAVLKARD